MGKAFDSIARGLNEAIAHGKGAKIAVKTYTPEDVDVSALRRRLGVTQEQFAGRFGFSVATLRHWERGDRSPQGAALAFLNVIKRAPDAVATALNAAMKPAAKRVAARPVAKRAAAKHATAKRAAVKHATAKPVVKRAASKPAVKRVSVDKQHTQLQN